MKRWRKIENSIEELIKSNCSINEFRAKVLTSAILDVLVQEGLVVPEGSTGEPATSDDDETATA